MSEEKSKILSKLWPKYFSNPIVTKDDIIEECKILLEEIERRYKIDCNPNITRNQINKIEDLLGLIPVAQSPDVERSDTTKLP